MIRTDEQTKTTVVIVPPLNGRREALGLAAAIAAICLIVALRVSLLNSQTSIQFMEPYHRLDNTLNNQERSLYQTLLTAQGEITYLWEENKTWPTANFLGQEGIPPFAESLLPANLKGYTWETYDRGPWVDYIGHDESGTENSPSFLLRTIDLHAKFHPHPHPGKDYDPDQTTASQIWFHPLNNQHYPGMQLAERGWFWIISPDDPILSVTPKTNK